MVEPDLLTPVVLVKNDEFFLPYALEASWGFFGRYVIYNIGSTDRTQEIIERFVDSCPDDVEFYIRHYPHVDPAIQGAFRNSMIAEARSEYYFILDADEVYTSESYYALIRGVERMEKNKQLLYGIVRRVEVCGDLKTAYGLKSRVPHHRLYHRKAIWVGSHPGEAPFYPQKDDVQTWIDDVVCYHFHGCERSSKDPEVPRRIERRSRGTYKPGSTEPFDLFEALPIMKTRIHDFPLNTNLAKLQDDTLPLRNSDELRTDLLKV